MIEESKESIRRREAATKSYGEIQREQMAKMRDDAHTVKQVGGNHYAKFGEFQPVNVLEKWMTKEELRGWAKGNAIVYLAREGHKGRDEDLKKAMHTLQLYFEASGSDE